jgi:hypothetical protein
MVDPARLAEGEAGFESSVLGAWQGRQPSEGARMKALAALGVSGLALTAAGSAAGKAGASIPPKAVVASSLLKWLGIGAGLAATAGGIGYASLRTTSEATSTPARTSARVAATAPVSPTAARPAVSSVGAARAAPSPVTAESPSPDVRASMPEEHSHPAADRVTQRAVTKATNTTAAVNAAATKTATPAAAASSLDEEVVAVDQARRALAAGNGSAALDLVDAYDAKYPGGALAQESAEIRIETLFRSGERATAEKLAERFLAAHPMSPYARVIRSFVAGAAPAAP